MPFIAPVLAIAGTVASAAGGIASADSSAGAAKYQSQIANNNAVIAGMQRSNAITAGHEQTYEKSLAGAEQVSRLKASMGANGVDVNTGSNVDVIGSDRAANQLGAETTLANSQKAAWGYQLQEEGYHDQANLYGADAKSDQTAGLIKAGTSAIGGLGSVVGGAGTGMFGSSSPTADNSDYSATDDANDLGYFA